MNSITKKSGFQSRPYATQAIKNARRSDAAGGDSTSGKPSVLLKEIYSTARSRGLAIILRIEEEKATSRAERVSATAIP